MATIRLATEGELPVRILIAEDDTVIADGLTQSLRHAGYAVDCARTGTEADAALAAGQYDLVILDLGLPKLNGFEVLKRLRARHSEVPVLILTALDAVSDRVRGLDLGADDYLAKPFALSELEARVRALTRRGPVGASSLLQHGNLTYDQVNRLAELKGAPLDLSAREMGLLEILLRRAGRVVSKERLVEHMCEWSEEISNNAIEVYMHRLRKKLDGSDVKIVTVRGLGYCLEKNHGA
jgi:two-component system OmpR family response regulator